MTTRPLIATALLILALTACSTTRTPTTTSTGTTSTPLTSTDTSAGVGTPTVAPSLPTTTRAGNSTTDHPSGVASSIGAALATKVFFYAIAKTATGITDTAQLDALATGICQRIDAGHIATVGAWLDTSYHLTGDTAAKVAIFAIKYACPQDAHLVGAG